MPVRCARGAKSATLSSTSMYLRRSENSHLALDQFAVCIGPDVTTQGSSRAYIPHTRQSPTRSQSNDMYNPAFKVAIRQLKAYDEMYDLRRSGVKLDVALFDDDDADEYTSLAERAERAWEGPDSLNGKVTSSLTPFATTSLYFGRTFPLRLLSDSVPAAFAHYILIIWVCPRLIWLVYFAKPLVFSVVDSTFCGYVPTNAKATVNHMIDTDGTRADLARILREARHGTAFYHSDSQPQPNVETGDDESSDPGEHDSCSEYELARSRSIISTEIRDRLLSERRISQGASQISWCVSACEYARPGEMVTCIAAGPSVDRLCVARSRVVAASTRRGATYSSEKEAQGGGSASKCVRCAAADRVSTYSKCPEDALNTHTRVTHISRR